MFRSHGQLDYVFQNFPIDLSFAGMRGNTMQMQSHGWEFAMNKLVAMEWMHESYYISGRHRGLKLYVMSAEFRADLRNGIESLKHIEVPIRACSEEMVIQVSMPANLQWGSVDFSKPSVLNMKNINIEDYIPFKPEESEAELYVPDTRILSLREQLQEIVEAQKPKQAELREKKRKQERRDMKVYEGAENQFDYGQGKKDVKLKLISVAS